MNGILLQKRFSNIFIIGSSGREQRQTKRRGIIQLFRHLRLRFTVSYMSSCLFKTIHYATDLNLYFENVYTTQPFFPDTQRDVAITPFLRRLVSCCQCITTWYPINYTFTRGDIRRSIRLSWWQSNGLPLFSTFTIDVNIQYIYFEIVYTTPTSASFFAKETEQSLPSNDDLYHVVIVPQLDTPFRSHSLAVIFLRISWW